MRRGSIGRRTIIATLAAGAAGTAGTAAMTGCTPRTVNTVNVAHDGASGSVTETDPVLARTAHLSEVRKGRAGDLLRVQADLTNQTSDEQQIYYRFVWLDAGGLTVDSPMTVWERQILQGGQTVSLSRIAPDPSVTDCRIELKRTAD